MANLATEIEKLNKITAEQDEDDDLVDGRHYEVVNHPHGCRLAFVVGGTIESYTGPAFQHEAELALFVMGYRHAQEEMS